MDYYLILLTFIATLCSITLLIMILFIFSSDGEKHKQQESKEETYGNINYIDKSSFIIGISGGTCSGKSTVCDKIISSIANELQLSNEEIGKHIIVLSQDRYYKGGSQTTNYDVPSALDFELMERQLNDLKNGKAVQAPKYDFTTHKRMEITDTIYPAPIIIVEGIMIFCMKEIRELIQLKVYVRAHRELRFYRRMVRDKEKRGRNEKEIVNRYFIDVLPSNNFYVEPSENCADIILVNNEPNKFIGMMFLLPFLKKKIKQQISL